MATFYAGQADYIAKLNTLATANEIAGIGTSLGILDTKVAAAAASATSASTSASTATTQATNASTSATSAAGSAATIATQATTATTKAAEAATSATAAAGSASTATTQATNAATSATSASASLTAVNLVFDTFDDRFLGSKTSAPTLDNDGNALVAGTVYYNSVTNTVNFYNGVSWEAPAASATASATAAAGSASTATTQATNAGTSAIAAAASATTAATQATNASTSATAAAASATTVTTQATNAASSATAAAASATTATTQATNAGTSATNAAASYDAFDDRYLGSKATNPALDNDGVALLTGALYWNNATPEMRVWNGTAWVAVQSTSAATQAAASATTAATQATNSGNSATLAQNWATQLVTPVVGGEYSAKYWAQQAAASITGSLIYRGSWSAATATYPSTPGTGDYYKVSVAGTVSSVDYAVNDSIIYNGTGWDKIDSTDSVTSVAGKVGVVTLVKADVGLGNVDNTSDVNKPVSTAQATAIATKQPLDTDLTAIAALVGTSGLLKKTAVDTWILDTIAYTTNTGTVTSVGGTGTVSGLSLSGTVTSAGNLTLGGTLAVTAANFASQTANTFLSAPTGVAGVPTFRAIVAADIPTLNQSTTGNAATATTVTDTQLGNTTHGLSDFAVAGDWSKPSGYQTMIRVSGTNTLGLPAGHGQSYFGYNVTSRRDGGGGYSATLTSFDNSNIYFTYNQDGTAYPTWRKILHESNFVAGTNYLTPTGSAANLTSFPTLNQNTTGTAANAGTLDNLDSTQFLRSDASTTYSGGVLTVTTSAGSLGTSASSVNTLQIFQATLNADAFQTFHASGDYAVHFGLDGTTNDLFVGGWSMGAVKNKIYHAGNFVAGTAYLTPTGSAASLTSFPTLNQNTTGTAASTPLVSSDSSMVFGRSGLQYFNISGAGGDVASTTNAPDGNWWHIIRGNHANGAGYYTDLALPMTSAGNIRYRRISAGVSSGWITVWDTTNLTNLNQLTNGPGYTTNLGTVTSVGGTGTVGGLSLSGTVTSTGNLTLSGTPSFAGSAITSGTVGTAYLGSGTANTTTYLRGDSTWATVSGGATVANDIATNASYYPIWTTITSGTPTTVYVSNSKLYFNPSTGTLNATTFNSLSDINLKENVVSIQDATSSIKAIKGVEFTWKDSGKKSSGVIAQELELVLPWLVDTSTEGTKSVNYAGLTGYLIESIKQLTARLEILENK